MTVTTKRGGFREGAGRKRLYDEPLKRQVVLLTPKEIKQAKKIGKGKGVSAGIRTLTDQYALVSNGEVLTPEYTFPDGDKKRTSVAISPEQVEILERVGNGNPRIGVRTLIAMSLAGDL